MLLIMLLHIMKRVDWQPIWPNQQPNRKNQQLCHFGVAVPADNIGGSSGPYLTNHRDFIQKVPRSLPSNWKLHHSDKTVADDLGPIQAHLFNAAFPWRQAEMA